MNLLCSYIRLCIIIIISIWGKLSFRESLKELGMKLVCLTQFLFPHSLTHNVCLFLFLWKHPETQWTESVSNSLVGTAIWTETRYRLLLGTISSCLSKIFLTVSLFCQSVSHTVPDQSLLTVTRFLYIHKYRAYTFGPHLL